MKKNIYKLLIFLLIIKSVNSIQQGFETIPLSIYVGANVDNKNIGLSNGFVYQGNFGWRWGQNSLVASTFFEANTLSIDKFFIDIDIGYIKYLPIKNTSFYYIISPILGYTYQENTYPIFQQKGAERLEGYNFHFQTGIGWKFGSFKLLDTILLPAYKPELKWSLQYIIGISYHQLLSKQDVYPNYYFDFYTGIRLNIFFKLWN